jgi:NTP pyrophosphatase (non-canonical NTP hydrolase)
MTDLTARIIRAKITELYLTRGYKWPDEMQALAFVNTELGECYELLLAKTKGWKRNNPRDKQPYSDDDFAKELGDAIMMLCVAGYVCDVDPIEAMLSKMDVKI